MQLTIDSREPLDDVLRAVGGLYGVTLECETRGASAAEPSSVSAAHRVKGRPSRGDAPAADARVVRAWATENGYAVSARGALSAEIRDAYAASLA